MTSKITFQMNLITSMFIINIFLQYCSGKGTHYFKANSIRCHTTEKLSIKNNYWTICAAVCGESEDKLCMGYRFEKFNSSCELCKVCSEATTQTVSMFVINYQDELNKGKCADKVPYRWLFENLYFKINFRYRVLICYWLVSLIKIYCK